MAAEPLDRSILLQDVFGNLLRWIAPRSRRNKDGEQFDFGQRLGADLGQLPTGMLPVLVLIHRTANVPQIRTAIKETGMVAKRSRPGCCYLRGNSLAQVSA